MSSKDGGSGPQPDSGTGWRVKRAKGYPIVIPYIQKGVIFHVGLNSFLTLWYVQSKMSQVWSVSSRSSPLRLIGIHNSSPRYGDTVGSITSALDWNTLTLYSNKPSLMKDMKQVRISNRTRS